jgi:hypothetical protein
VFLLADPVTPVHPPAPHRARISPSFANNNRNRQSRRRAALLGTTSRSRISRLHPERTLPSHGPSYCSRRPSSQRLSSYRKIYPSAVVFDSACRPCQQRRLPALGNTAVLHVKYVASAELHDLKCLCACKCERTPGRPSSITALTTKIPHDLRRRSHLPKLKCMAQGTGIAPDGGRRANAFCLLGSIPTAQPSVAGALCV